MREIDIKFYVDEVLYTLIHSDYSSCPDDKWQKKLNSIRNNSLNSYELLREKLVNLKFHLNS